LLELSAAYQAIAHKTPEHAKIVNDFMEAKAASPVPVATGQIAMQTSVSITYQIAE